MLLFLGLELSLLLLCLLVGKSDSFLVVERHRDGWMTKEKGSSETLQKPSKKPTIMLRSNGSDDDESTTTTKTTKIYEICLSPGCLADGAELTLQKMQALAPYSTSVCNVKAGVCQSLCGNGPIILNNETNQKIRKVTNDDKILKLLDIDTGKETTTMAAAILQAFECVNEAKDASDMETQRTLYEKAIAIGASTITDKEYSLDQILWLVEALKEQTQCLLKGNDKNQRAAAIQAAEKAVALVRTASSFDEDDQNSVLILHGCLECLQQALEACHDKTVVDKEVDTLQQLLELEPKKLTTTQQNKRRTLGFRLQKLQQRNYKNS
jgi:hypothetical protein